MQVEDEEWIKKTLLEAEKGISRVLELEAEEAVPKGDNYISDIFRLKLKLVLHSGDVQNISIIYKVIPMIQDESKMPNIKELGVFNTEIRMYTEVLPAMERLLREKDPLSEAPWPRLVGFKPDYEGLLIQDCTMSGFAMEDRTKGFDLESAAVALQGLARFHALASVAIKRGDISVSHFDKWLYVKKEANLQSLEERMTKSYLKVIEEVWGGEWLEFVDGLKELSRTFEYCLREFGRRDETKFNTLNHGDFWLNNILFKRDSFHKPNNIKIIDFQSCFYNNPCFDVNYFLSACLCPELFDRKPELLTIYYETLVKELGLFEYSDIPTFQDIHESYEKTKALGMYIGLIIRPFMTTRAVQAIRKEHPQVDIEFLTYLCLVYGGDYVETSAKATLKHYKQMGLIK